MYEAGLFLGFLVTEEYESVLKSADPKVLAYFIHNDGPYLQEITQENQKYLGKSIGGKIVLEELELLQENIYSLLKKLEPNYPYSQPLVILPLLSQVCS
jgi:hypothetical protein